MKEFYVYVYMNPLKLYNKEHLGVKFEFEPFYIGKGTKNRFKIHLKEAKKENKKSHKLNTIRKILNFGLEVKIEKIKQNLDEKEAYYSETEFIKDIGRKDIKTGPLTNLYDSQGVGLSEEQKEKQVCKGEKNGMYGKTHSDEVKRKLSEMKKKLIGNKAPRYGKVSSFKGKTYEEIYGKEKAEKLKIDRSNKLKNKKKNYKINFTKEIKDKIKKKRRERIQPYFVFSYLNKEVKKYECLKDMVEELKISRYILKSILNQKRKNYNILINRTGIFNEMSTMSMRN